MIVLIDGPSGAGKSALADRTLAAWHRAGHQATLVRMDSLYPGWRGLEEGSRHVEQELVAPFAAGRPAGWRSWDWEADAPGRWNSVPADRLLIVEGCGTLTRANAPWASIRVWLGAEDAVRHRRAIDRDGELFERWWDIWQDQFDAYLVRETPRVLANIRLDGSAPGADRVVLPFPRIR